MQARAHRAGFMVPLAALLVACASHMILPAPPAARAAIEEIGFNVCTRGLLVAVYGTESGYATVSYRVRDRSGEVDYIWSYERRDGSWIDFYFVEFEVPIPDGAVGQLFIRYPEGASATRDFIAYEDCRHVSQSQIRGVSSENAPTSPVMPPLAAFSSAVVNRRFMGNSYEDVNHNGVHDRNEPVLPNAFYKLTDGGNWFVCGFTDGDGEYRVSIDPGAYYVFPIAPPGYRPVTLRLKTEVVFGSSNFAMDMGFVKDPSAPLETCDLYNPPRGGDMPVVVIGPE